MVPDKCPEFKNTCQRKERQILEEIVPGNYMKNAERGKKSMNSIKMTVKAFVLL